MKMSQVVACIVAATGGAGGVRRGLTMTSSRPSKRPMASTAKRKRTGMDGRRMCTASVGASFRSAFVPAFGSPCRLASSSSGSRTDGLPWTPIYERDPLRSAGLHMTPYGTEGFRDAVRGSEGYIKPRGPDKGQQSQEDDHSGQPQQSSTHQQQKRSMQQNSQGQRIPFPKLSPGRTRNYRPPHVVAYRSSLNRGEDDYYPAKEDSGDHIESFREKRRFDLSAEYDEVDDVPAEVSPNALDQNAEAPQRHASVLRAPQSEDVVDTRDLSRDEPISAPDNSDQDKSEQTNLVSRGSQDRLDAADANKAGRKLDSLRIESDTPGQPEPKSAYVGPSSMNFRDGSRMTSYKDSAFRTGSDPGAEDPEPYMMSGYRDIYDGEEQTKADLLRMDDDDDDDKKEAKPRETVITVPNVKKPPSRTLADTDATLLSMDPRSIEIIPLKSINPADEELRSTAQQLSLSPFNAWSGDTTGSFVKMFRGSASYIANHRGTLAVYHIPGELLTWEGFPGLMDDIALTWLLGKFAPFSSSPLPEWQLSHLDQSSGMKIVLVAGCRHQIDLRLEDIDDGDGGKASQLGGRVMMSSIRVTDEETLRVVKEEAGFVRFEIERRLAKSLRLHGGILKGSESLVGNVVSGNFYSAQPFGVVDGVDYAFTGFPRKVEVERIKQVHETNDIVLLTSLGVSPSGELFNVNSEFLAASVAGSLGATKIIYFNVHGTSFLNTHTGKPVQNLRARDAKNLLDHYKMRIHPKGFALLDLDSESPRQSILRTPGSLETLIKVGYSMVALEKGVKRAHILAPENGALVQELYTRDGCGTLISRDIYEGIRRADVNDVSGIYDLIDPLVKSGTLVERPKSTLEKEAKSYYVYTRDNLVVATGQLKRYEGGFAEIGCLVVSKDYRRGGRGDAMLGYLERLALQSGATKVFVLSTQTMEWFVERGFREVPVGSLPPSRQSVYNQKRKSKIYMKEINGDRDLDAAELWWSNKA